MTLRGDRLVVDGPVHRRGHGHHLSGLPAGVAQANPQTPYGTLDLAAASLPFIAPAIAALLLGIRLQKRMSLEFYSKILRATLAAFVVLLTGQAAIELVHRFAD